MNKSIDEILSQFSQQNDGKSITLTWTNKDVVSEAKDQLYQLIKEVIGEYETEYSNLDGDAGYWEKHGRNDLRAKQLTALNKVFGREA